MTFALIIVLNVIGKNNYYDINIYMNAMYANAYGFADQNVF